MDFRSKLDREGLFCATSFHTRFDRSILTCLLTSKVTRKMNSESRINVNMAMTNSGELTSKKNNGTRANINTTKARLYANLPVRGSMSTPLTRLFLLQRRSIGLSDYSSRNLGLRIFSMPEIERIIPASSRHMAIMGAK